MNCEYRERRIQINYYLLKTKEHSLTKVENQEKSTGKKWSKKRSFLEEDDSDTANDFLRAQSRFLEGSGRLRRPIKRKDKWKRRKRNKKRRAKCTFLQNMVLITLMQIPTGRLTSVELLMFEPPTPPFIWKTFAARLLDIGSPPPDFPFSFVLPDVSSPTLVVVMTDIEDWRITSDAFGTW